MQKCRNYKVHVSQVCIVEAFASAILKHYNIKKLNIAFCKPLRGVIW